MMNMIIRHPDKNPDDREAAEVKFREVAEAYEALHRAIHCEDFKGSCTTVKRRLALTCVAISV